MNKRYVYIVDEPQDTDEWDQNDEDGGMILSGEYLPALGYTGEWERMILKTGMEALMVGGFCRYSRTYMLDENKLIQWLEQHSLENCVLKDSHGILASLKKKKKEIVS